MRTTALVGLLACACPAWAACSDQVTDIASAATSAAFAKGQPLIEAGTYKVHASRREVDGVVGPVWRPSTQDLLFSDPNRNTIYRYASDGTLEVFRHPSGCAGLDIGAYGQPGSIGLALDRMNRLTLDDTSKVVMAYDLAMDGSVTNARVFADLTTVPGEDAIDGVKVDAEGHVYVSGAGLRHRLHPEGTPQ